jgi:hypothetical protein
MRFAAAVGFACVFCAVRLSAQNPAPSKVLLVVQEFIKEGKSGAHSKSESAFIETLRKVKFPAHVLGLTSITGTSEAWFLEGYDSFAAIAESRAAMNRPEFGPLEQVDSALRTGSRTLIAVYRPELSNAVENINLAKARYFDIETVQGSVASPSGNRQPRETYEVVSGAPDGTYLVLKPMESMKALDEDHSREPGGEALLFSIDPKMSLVPKEWTAADPAFWAPKLPTK